MLLLHLRLDAAVLLCACLDTLPVFFCKANSEYCSELLMASLNGWHGTGLQLYSYKIHPNNCARRTLWVPWVRVDTDAIPIALMIVPHDPKPETREQYLLH